MRMVRGFKEQFRLSNLSLHHPHPYRFVTAQCHRARLYGCWRVLWAVYHVSWVVLSWVGTGRGEGVKWLIYLSHWTYLLLALHALLETVTWLWVHAVSTRFLCQQQTAMPWYLKVQWVLFNVVNTGSVMVTIWYWIVLYRGGWGEMGGEVALHALNSVYVLLNLLVTATPTRPLHALHPLLYGWLYTLFTAIFQLAGATNTRGDPYVYRLTDWSRPALTLLTSALSNMLAVPAVHLAICGLRAALLRWGCWQGPGAGRAGVWTWGWREDGEGRVAG